MTAPVEADPHLAARLRIAVARLYRRIRLKADMGVSPLQLSTLASIEKYGPLRLGELAARESMTAPTMTRLLALLDERELIVRSPDPVDARSTRVALSEAGAALLDEVRSQGTALLDAWMARLPEEQRAALAAALPALEALGTED
ncbi:MarR family transcriptional regulator [Rugosimonospora acidiphila]|uniref:MarR family transcriptional regulator n=1 Tax=Rugosimonospora acidiphila TaxID=556531 RepID=A0ABP9RYE5_9ACTN